jgi:hypothetical protein
VGLRQQANDALDFMVSDPEGFGWPIKITSPEGASADLIGLSSDVAETIDVETGVAVAGRSAHVALQVDDLTAAGLKVPVGIAESPRRPWVVDFEDIAGRPYRFKVSEARHDRAVGLVLCFLESFE